MFFYVYVLESIKDKGRYIGYTTDLRRRVAEHNKGKGIYTGIHRPHRLIYFEGCTNMQDAKRREQYLKTHQGRKFLGLRLIRYKNSKQTFGMGG